jgi:Restriction endonuclease XhoI
MDRRAFENAVRDYWRVRAGQASKQEASGRVDAGLRGAVTGGAHMDAMAKVIEAIFIDAGFPPASVNRSSAVELPGYYRPEKKWDLVVVHGDTLAAAIEFKSHVGPSFGNNYNNRTEEAIGNAVDVWTAFREGRFGTTRSWLGYLFLLEEAPKSTAPVRVREPFFAIDEAFRDASYKERYEIFCRRLLLERLYDAACFLTASADPASPIHEPAADLNFEAFARAIRARAAALLITER